MWENELLLRENYMFEPYLEREKAMSENERQETVATPSSGRAPSRRGKSKKSKPPSTLTLEQKNYIAEDEIRARREQIAKLIEAHERETINFEAMIGETRARIDEMKKETYEFKRQVLVGGVDKRSGKILSSAVIKYYEDKIRKKDGLVQRLAEKNIELAAKQKSLAKELKEKEHRGETLSPVDFHQLEIENKSYSERIAQKNKKLLRLKASTAKLGQTLNDKRVALTKLLERGVKLRKRITSAQALEARLVQDSKDTKVSIKKMESKIKKLKLAATTASDMPQIEDYVQQKAEEHELRRKIRQWEKKVEIAKAQARRVRAAAEATRKYSRDRPSRAQTGADLFL